MMPLPQRVNEQLESQPSPSVKLPSSHSSPSVWTLLPHPVAVQLKSQPSPFMKLASSHCSLPLITPFPHSTSILHRDEHPSPSFLFPSSQSSPSSVMPSPHSSIAPLLDDVLLDDVLLDALLDALLSDPPVPLELVPAAPPTPPVPALPPVPLDIGKVYSQAPAEKTSASHNKDCRDVMRYLPHGDDFMKLTAVRLLGLLFTVRRFSRRPCASHKARSSYSCRLPCLRSERVR